MRRSKRCPILIHKVWKDQYVKQTNDLENVGMFYVRSTYVSSKQNKNDLDVRICVLGAAILSEQRQHSENKTSTKIDVFVNNDTLGLNLREIQRQSQQA